MELYLITADVYCDDFGSYIECFGIATNAESLETIKQSVIEKGFAPMISIIEANTIMEVDLGGYVE